MLIAPKKCGWGWLYDLLRDNRLRAGLRLEQERIGFGWVGQSLAALQPSTHVNP